FGFGISRSTISKSAPGLEICATFIGATTVFVAAMLASYEFSLSHLVISSAGRHAGHCAAWLLAPETFRTLNLQDDFQLDRSGRPEDSQRHTPRGWGSLSLTRRLAANRKRRSALSS